jgi:hypothetical protein
MSAIRETDPRSQTYAATGGGLNECGDVARFHGDTRHGSVWTIAGLVVLSLAVVGAIRLWPDFVRYMKIRNM